MAGRKPKITLDMNDRADQRRRTEKMIAETSELEPLQKTPPRHLKGIAFSSWNELWPILTATGWVNQADKNIVASLCEQLAVKYAAYASIEKLGIVMRDGKKNPACQVLNDSTAKVKTLSDALGLNPHARTSIIGDATPEDDMDPEDIIAAMKDKKSGEDW